MVWEPLILGVVIFHVLLHLFMVRMLVITIRLELEDLDTKIGAALRSLIESGMGEYEPPSPIQMALAEVLKRNVLGQAGGDPVEVIRDAGGKFA